MKTTGYALREAIKQHEMRRDTANMEFAGTLKKFDEDEKPHPDTVMEQLQAAEEATAILQAAQTQYNLAVRFPFDGKTISLCQAVKRIGGLGRIEKMWRTAASTQPQSIYSGYETTRDPNQIRAKDVFTSAEALKKTSVATKKASALRAAIATANAQEVEIEDLDPALFE